MTVTVAGGRGGDSGLQLLGSSGQGSNGALVTATIAVTPGQVLSAVIGCAGSNGSNSSLLTVDGAIGWSNGGDAGHGQNLITAGAQAGPGGASSAICLGSTCAADDPSNVLVVAGGGGGGAVSNCLDVLGALGGIGGIGLNASIAGGSGPSGGSGLEGGLNLALLGGGSAGPGGSNADSGHGAHGIDGTNGLGGLVTSVVGGGGGGGYSGGGSGGNAVLPCVGGGGGGAGSSWVTDIAFSVLFDTSIDIGGIVSVEFNADLSTCTEDITVTTETEFRDGLACLGDKTDPVSITLDDDVVIDDGSDPVYTGDADLVIDGNGHGIDADDSSRILDHDGDSMLTLSDVTITGTVGAVSGGAVTSAGPITIERSTFDDNQATNLGGAVHAAGPITIADSTFMDNTAGQGGGAVNSDQSVTASNSTFVGNTSTAGSGGALRGVQGVAINHSTIVGNHAPVGSNVAVESGPLTRSASVLADPLGGGSNCSIGEVSVSDGDNYADDTSCALTGVRDRQSEGNDPELGRLRNNGGPNPTMYPLNGSPLIDVIPAGSCTANGASTLDQRGGARPFGAGCDIGAIESVFPAHAMSDATPFYEATIRWVTSEINTPQILNGYNDSTFRPSVSINRGQVVRMYYRAAGAPDVSSLPPHGFSDVSPFFENAVRWAKANNVFDGYPDLTFRETKPINRGNATRSLWGFVGRPDVSSETGHRMSDVTPFYDDAVTWAMSHGLADGFNDNTFRQSNNITRGNASRIFYNAAQTPGAWATPATAFSNMLFQSNL